MSENLQIYIAGREIKHFNGFSMSHSLDAVGDQFSFTCPFFPETPVYREIFRPFAYQRVCIDINGDPRFTGRIESISPQLSGNQSTVEVSGRSLTGSLIDCTFEQADMPLQFTSAKLDEIAARVLRGFDFTAVFESDPGARFEEAGPSSPSESRFDFLHNLAKQRQLLMGQTAEGNLLFRRAVSSGSVAAVLTEGQHGLTISSATYDGTQRFSSCDVFGQEPGENANFARVVDPAITGAYRPKASQANDTNAANITEAAKWLVTAELAQAITIPIAVEGWRRPDGKLWAENTLIALTAPSLMIYRQSTLIIKTVQFNRTENQDTTSLSLTIPGAYTGVLPEVYPWAA